MKPNLTRQEIRSALTGPFGSIRTPFNQDGSVDYDGLRNHVERNIQNGAGTVLLTAGDSHFHILSDSEIAEVTRATVEQTAGRALVVAADRRHSTTRAVDFARHVRELGADVLMVLPPDWASSCTTRTLVEHYGAVAREIPVMLVTNLFIPRGSEFGLETLKVLVERVEGIVAIKNDFLGQFARRMCLLVHEHWAVFSGGHKQNHLDLHPYGCDGYMSTYLIGCDSDTCRPTSDSVPDRPPILVSHSGGEPGSGQRGDQGLRHAAVRLSGETAGRVRRGPARHAGDLRHRRTVETQAPLFPDRPGDGGPAGPSPRVGGSLNREVRPSPTGRPHRRATRPFRP